MFKLWFLTSFISWHQFDRVIVIRILKDQENKVICLFRCDFKHSSTKWEAVFSRKLFLKWKQKLKDVDPHFIDINANWPIHYLYRIIIVKSGIWKICSLTMLRSSLSASEVN